MSEYMDPRVGEIEAAADGLTDLCPEYLRQIIRHVQRNCDIECNEHPNGDPWDECKQPERYDGERMAKALAGIPYLLAELRKAQRAAQTLGQVIEKQCRDVLEVTGLHHLINADGDGHWDVVWMRLFEMRDELTSLKESTIGRERLRGEAWRDRAQETTVRLDAAVEELRRRDEVIASLSDWAGRYKSAYYDEAQDDVVQIIKPVLRAAVAAANGDGE